MYSHKNHSLSSQTDYKNIDFRKHPELYRAGKDELEGFLVEPYKSEILPYWRFQTPEAARNSSARIYKLFLSYKAQRDFVGMDVARKFLQMGFSRSRRYIDHVPTTKYSPYFKKAEAANWQKDEKELSAHFFYKNYIKVSFDTVYRLLLEQHLKSDM